MILIWVFYCLAVKVGRSSFVMNKLCAHFFDGKGWQERQREEIYVHPVGAPSARHEVYIVDLYFCVIGLLDGGVEGDG